MEGTLEHVFWECPKIQDMWKEVENILKRLPVNLSHIPPHMALLHLKVIDLPPRERFIHNHVYVSTRILLAENWKLNYIPKIEEIIKRVEFNLSAEKAWATKIGSLDSFMAKIRMWSLVYPETKLFIDLIG
ncbi:hypothetical protein XELAEV_18007748mg [Xenopus laevis]|uniref:Uncharacterized protein n=2 Tax=Xenopus laevis TaxID=8355 RepID=A0A974GYT8_XENLA|nr:hypothetical protein XELAEV_18003066mg [Xenopus laevis]OCT92442.1 hypothetical protein XELAEV_18015497mg [Xenopus laevis]OCU01989.1 hypothetical protein XELAEV_18007748mg [Xenopus laevis]